MAHTIEHWERTLTPVKDEPELEVFALILNNIGGYGGQGVQTVNDAQNLLNAFIAWKRIPWK